MQSGDDEQGIEDMERGIEIADSINTVESARGYGNLASGLSDRGDLERAFEMIAEARMLPKSLRRRESWSLTSAFMGYKRSARMPGILAL